MMERTPLRVALLFGVGAFLLQSAWILAVPPFRGSDEFDHAYRANSVAEGYWRTWDEPSHGRGDLVPVRRSIIEAAQEICRGYSYTGPDNCRPVEDLGHGMATVATAASRYHPVFYWVVGLPSLSAEGAAALYMMRWFAALICATLIALGAGLLATWSRTPWPLAGLAVALTPVLVYSTSIPAPNGVEMLAGAGLWVCLLTLAKTEAKRLPALVALASLFVSVLVTVRPLGALWSALILTTVLLAVGRSHATRAVRAHPRLTSLGALTAATSIVASVAWYITAGTHEIETIDSPDFNRWTASAGQIPAWMLQTVAAFPLRNNPAPMIVYALVFLSFSGLVLAALTVGDSRSRRSLLLGSALAVVVPYAFTVATATRYGAVWQGRYGLPFTVGLTILSGHILATSHRRSPIGRPAAYVLGVGLVAAHVVSVVNVHLKEVVNSPLSGDPRWLQVPVVVTGLLATLGLTMWAMAVFKSGHKEHPHVIVEDLQSAQS